MHIWWFCAWNHNGQSQIFIHLNSSNMNKNFVHLFLLHVQKSSPDKFVSSRHSLWKITATTECDQARWKLWKLGAMAKRQDTDGLWNTCRKISDFQAILPNVGADQKLPSVGRLRPAESFLSLLFIIFVHNASIHAFPKHTSLGQSLQHQQRSVQARRKGSCSACQTDSPQQQIRTRTGKITDCHRRKTAWQSILQSNL